MSSQPPSTDSGALFKAAEAALRGTSGPVDLKAAYTLMSQAAALGLTEAKRAQAYFTASGIGTKPDPEKARTMLAKLAKDDRFVGPFTMAQAIAVALALLGIAIMAWRREPRPGAPGIYGPAFKPATAA